MPGYVLGNFFIYSVINAFTPGPGNILALNTVTNYGCKKGRPLFWGIFTEYITDYSTSLWVLLLFEIIIATIGTIATLTWVGMGVLIQRVYQKYYRVINIILALTLLECVYALLRAAC